MTALVIPTQSQLTAGGPAPTTVAQLSSLAAQQVKLEDEIAALTATLALKNDQLRVMKQITIPMAMLEAGVTSIGLPSGHEIIVADFLAANITEEDRPAAHAWLRKNKLGGIIKSEFKLSFGKGEDAAAKKMVAMLNKMKVKFTRKEAVNWQTLQAFVKERLQAGKALPPEINVTKVPTTVVNRPEEK